MVTEGITYPAPAAFSGPVPDLPTPLRPNQACRGPYKAPLKPTQGLNQPYKDFKRPRKVMLGRENTSALGLTQA